MCIRDSCDSLGTASPEEMDTLMEELGTIQDTLTMHDFYVDVYKRQVLVTA